MPSTPQSFLGDPYYLVEASRIPEGTATGAATGLAIPGEQHVIPTDSVTFQQPSMISDFSPLTESTEHAIPTNIQQPQQPRMPPPYQHQPRQKAKPATYTNFDLNAPKKELHALYGKPHRQTVISNSNFFTWNDDGQHHILKWTSIFVCPITGELFRSGRYHGAAVTNDDVQSIVWYPKKIQAEHGAAARAFDCLNYRDQTAATHGKAVAALPTIGIDTPYPQNQGAFEPQTLGLGVPAKIINEIQLQQNTIRQRYGDLP